MKNSSSLKPIYGAKKHSIYTPLFYTEGKVIIIQVIGRVNENVALAPCRSMKTLLRNREGSLYLPKAQRRLMISCCSISFS